MKYPIKSNWISFENSSKEHIYRIINHFSGDEYEVEENVIWVLERLDGTVDPIRLLMKKGLSREQAGVQIEVFEDCGFVRTSYRIKNEERAYIRTLIMFKDSTKYETVSKIFMTLIILATFWGVHLIISNIFTCWGKVIFYDALDDKIMVWLGLITGVLVGGALHEVSHAISAMAFSGKVMEFGISFKGLPALYTMMDMDGISTRLGKIQTILAGVEMNLIIAGISFWIGTKDFSCMGIFFIMALVNLELAIANLLFIEGLDGMQIMDLILPGDDMVENAKRLRKDIELRKKVFYRNETGKIRVCAAYMLGATKLIYPLLIIFNFVILLGW